MDPAITQTQQPYAYADGNPVSSIDPTGAYWESGYYSGWWGWTIYWLSGHETEELIYKLELIEVGAETCDMIFSIFPGAGELVDAICARYSERPPAAWPAGSRG